MQIQTFLVSGISCGSCVNEIESAFSNLDKLDSFEVLRSPDRLKVKTKNGMTSSGINELFQKFDLIKYKVSDFEPQKGITHQPSLLKQLYPLTLVISYILLGVVTVAWATSDFSFSSMMFHYMAGFFLVFSFFKFLNINGFVDAFQTYDPLAKSWRPYGYFYATFELLAGVGYLSFPKSLALNSVVLIVLSISSWGVFKAVRNKSRIQCACLGTIFNLPMTKVTIIENVSMITMALIILAKGF